MNENLKYEILLNCQLINRGVKSASIIPFQERYLSEVIEIIKKEPLYYLLEPQSTDGWRNIWIYKNPALKIIIESLPECPETPSDHFILGVIFGYSIDSILEYIQKQTNKSNN